MKMVLEQSDGEFLNELHRIGPKTVQDICAAIGVTATAVPFNVSRANASAQKCRLNR